MSDLNTVYEHIRRAEQKCRSGDLSDALDLYVSALEGLDLKSPNFDLQGLDDTIIEAVKLLRDDIELRIKELQICVIESSKDEKDSKNNKASMALVQSSAGNNNNLAASKYWDSTRNITDITSSTFIDPYTSSMLSKLQNSMVDLIKEAKNQKTDVNDLVSTALFQIDQFKKEMLIYEQRRTREYQIKVEHLNKDVKKLSSQNSKLKERWDSLVESARQRKNRQQGL